VRVDVGGPAGWAAIGVGAVAVAALVALAVLQLGSDGATSEGGAAGAAAGTAGGRQAPAGSVPARDPVLSETYVVNVVETWDHGCSDDPLFFGGTEADLEVTVHLRDEVVLRSASDDTDHAIHAAFAPVMQPGDLLIEVADLEGGAPKVPCDVGGGAEGRIMVQWEGKDMTVRLRGEAGNAAEVVLVVGRAPVRAPEARQQGLAADRAWLAVSHPIGPVSAMEVVDGSGRSIGSAKAEESRLAIAGLCDGRTYRVLLAARSSPWLLGTWVDVQTDNWAPEPARVISAQTASGRLELEWEDYQDSQATRYELHVGPAGFEPGSDTLRGSSAPQGIYWRQRSTVEARAGDAEVMVRAIEPDRLFSDSARMRVGSPALEPERMGQRACSERMHLVV
jgi:hypothetical protein